MNIFERFSIRLNRGLFKSDLATDAMPTGKSFSGRYFYADVPRNGDIYLDGDISICTRNGTAVRAHLNRGSLQDDEGHAALRMQFHDRTVVEEHYDGGLLHNAMGEPARLIHHPDGSLETFYFCRGSQYTPSKPSMPFGRPRETPQAEKLEV